MPKNTKKKTRTIPEIQHAAMWGLVKQNMTEEEFRVWIFELTNGESESSSDLTFEMKNHIIKKLGGNPFTKPTANRRTANYQKQKAGVETLVTPTYIDAMKKRWRQVEGRTDEGLETLCLRINKVKRPRTMKECSKVIEAIKSMNKRAAAATAKEVA
jgi:flagellar motility protein MotE (MotC chaperone)